MALANLLEPSVGEIIRVIHLDPFGGCFRLFVVDNSRPLPYFPRSHKVDFGQVALVEVFFIEDNLHNVLLGGMVVEECIATMLSHHKKDAQLEQEDAQVDHEDPKNGVQLRVHHYN